jgi:hypothetical protein
MLRSRLIYTLRTESCHFILKSYWTDYPLLTFETSLYSEVSVEFIKLYVSTLLLVTYTLEPKNF